MDLAAEFPLSFGCVTHFNVEISIERNMKIEEAYNFIIPFLIAHTTNPTLVFKFSFSKSISR